VGRAPRHGVLPVRQVRDWTPAETETLRQGLADGLNAGAIALMLNRTRNSVLGKAMRERMIEAGRKQPRKQKPMPLKRMPVSGYTRTWYTRRPILRDAQEIELTEWDKLPPNAPGLVKLQDLGPRDCRFGLNNALHGEFYFCAQPRKHRSSYCEAHHEICYIKREQNNG